MPEGQESDVIYLWFLKQQTLRKAFTEVVYNNLHGSIWNSRQYVSWVLAAHNQYTKQWS